MNKKFKSVCLGAICASMLLSGCGSQAGTQDLSLRVTLPSGSKLNEVDVVDKTWVSLDQLTTYPGFREDFDKQFRINLVSTPKGDTKQGCIYTAMLCNKEVQCGNSTMRAAFRNAAFDKYFNDHSIQSSLSNLAEKAYTDIESTDSASINSTLNAYFNLLSESTNDPTYESTLSLTRDEFYTLVCKASTPVGKADKATDVFKSAVINSDHSDFIYTMSSKGILSYEDGSLNADNISKPISTLEALYMLVNNHFSDQLSAIEVSDTAEVYGYKPVKDLETRIKLDSPEASRSKSLNLLGYMLNNKKSEISEEVYRVLKVASQLDLLKSIDSVDMNRSITKNEAIQLLINTYEAENKVYGYLTNTEYPDYVISDDKLVCDLRYPDESITIFPEQQVIYEKIKSEADKSDLTNQFEVINDLVSSYESTGELPPSSLQSYLEWNNEQNKSTAGSLSGITEVSNPSTPTQAPSTSTSKPSNNSSSNSGKTPSSPTTKPKNYYNADGDLVIDQYNPDAPVPYWNSDLPEGMRPGESGEPDVAGDPDLSKLLPEDQRSNPKWQ